MFKDVFVLKKTSWHARLMKYIWNINYYDFSHMCPYFWLSIFNIIVVPLVFLVKTVIVGFVEWIGKLIISFGEMLDDRFERWADRQYISVKENRDEDLEKIISIPLNKKCGKKYSRFLDRLWSKDFTLYQDIMKKRQVYWDNYYEQQRIKDVAEWEANADKREAEKLKNEHLARIEKLKEESRAKRRAKRWQRSRNNKERINYILKFIKPIAIAFMYVLGAGVILAAIAGIIKLLSLLGQVKHKIWVNIGTGAIVVSIIISLICTVAIIVKLLQKLDWHMSCKTKARWTEFFSYFSYLRHLRHVIRPFVYLGKKIGIVIVFLAKGAGSFICLLIQMIKNSCPAIQWK